MRERASGYFPKVRKVETNTIPSFETANQGVMPVEGHDQIAGVGAVICSGARARMS